MPTEKINDLWPRINALVPNPDCTTCDGVILKWKDKRKQPSKEELETVDLNIIPDPANLVWQEFDEANTIDELKLVLEKFLGR